MKWVSIISGVLIIALLIMLLTGLVNFDDGINKFLVRGNRQYADNNYEQALSAYNAGLKKDSENFKLNYNSGQASYLLKDYQNAATYYDKACDTPDKYLNSGNSSLKLGDGTEDVNEKMQYYRLALDKYKKGILAFPENVPLKYNYEYVKKKLEELGDNSGEKQDNEENQDENEENQDENEENQDENEENQDENEENQDNQNQDNSQDGQNDSQQQNEEEQGDDTQNQDGEQGDDTQNQDGEQGDDTQNQDGEQDDDMKNQDGEQGDDTQNQDGEQGDDMKNQDGEQEQDSQQQENNPEQDKDESERGQSEQDQGQDETSSGEQYEGSYDDNLLQQVLRMLEKQEEESLKNNQEVRNYGEEDEYDW